MDPEPIYDTVNVFARSFSITTTQGNPSDYETPVTTRGTKKNCTNPTYIEVYGHKTTENHNDIINAYHCESKNLP